MIMLDFKLENNSSNYLKNMFNGTDFTNYKWFVYEDDANSVEEKNNTSRLFNASSPDYVISGRKFHESIKREEHKMIFIVIFAFPIQSKIPVLYTLKDVIMSDCDLAYMLYDGIYGSVYCKNEDLLNTILKNCIRTNIDAKYKDYSSEEINRFKF